MRHLADLLGVPFANVQRWLKNPDKPPSVVETERIARVLGYDVCLVSSELNWTYSDRDKCSYAFTPNGYFVLEKETDGSWEWHFIYDREGIQHPQGHYCGSKTEAMTECEMQYRKMKKSGFRK